MSSNKLGLSPSLMQALKDLKYNKPTPIQAAAIPAVLEGKDVLGIAPTGSGKTASFVLPTLMKLEKDKTILRNRRVKALVLVPTRELAMQVNEVFQDFGKRMPKPIRTMAVFGGVSINPQMMNLNNIHVLIATPGRLLELLEKKSVQLSDVRTLILDEADKMLNRSFQEELNSILALLPKKRQNLLFSATLSPAIEEVKQILLDDPKVIKIAPKENHIELINQSAYVVTDEKKGPLLRYLIKTSKYKQVMVFTYSTIRADKISAKLIKNGIKALPIHGKKSQGARTQALHKFKTGAIQVLVATDLLSRGIDIEFLPCVINYELPRSPKDYIHRIGRTGRAENAGDAISLVTRDDLAHFKTIQKKMGKWVELTYSEEINLHGF